MVRIRGVETLGGFRVRLSLTDDTTREVDLGPYLNGPVFEPLRANAALFQTVRVDPDLGTIVWPNGADIDLAALSRAVAAHHQGEAGAGGLVAF